jgi:hypothetical protein
MKSASVVKITSGASARNLVDYNQQESKVTGQWRKQDGEYQPTELLKYVGDQSKPYLSLDEQGQYFVANAKGNLDLSRKIGQAAKIKSSEVHTIIQSFDYQINPELTPGEANQMGIEYFAAIQDYLKDKYNYELDLGMVSTHIDRSEIKMSATNLGKVNYPHLHNHIVIPSYNAQGVNIAPYLRKENIYAFKDLNDKIVDNHNLKDYRFAKLQHELYPVTTQTITKNTESSSHLQKAYQRFSEVNEIAWSSNPGSYLKALEQRDSLLKENYGYQSKLQIDTKTRKSQTRFTMKDFRDKSGKQKWYSISNLRCLNWSTKEQADAEQMLNQVDFKGAENQTPSYQEYKTTMYLTDDEIVKNPQNRSKPKWLSLKELFVKVKTVANKVEEKVEVYMQRANFYLEKLEKKRQSKMADDKKNSLKKEVLASTAVKQQLISYHLGDFISLIKAQRAKRQSQKMDEPIRRARQQIQAPITTNAKLQEQKKKYGLSRINQNNHDIER